MYIFYVPPAMNMMAIVGYASEVVVGYDCISMKCFELDCCRLSLLKIYSFEGVIIDL